MSVFKHYFKYKVSLRCCGLPYVTIECSIEDWCKINRKLDELRKYDLNFWIDKLVPILDKIIETKKGNVDKEYWLKIIKIKNHNGFYDLGFVDSWFTNFFPYDENGDYIYGPIYDRTKLASEMLTVLFELKLIQYEGQDESEVEPIKCEFLAGFVGMKQDEITSSMKPEIGWIFREKPEAKPYYVIIPNKWDQ